jgi:excisionase family DNA binding protein
VTVRNRTPRVLPQWMSIAEVAKNLGVSPDTALRRVKSGSIPGGERMYRFEGRKGERWHVKREAYSAWRSAVREQATG